MRKVKRILSLFLAIALTLTMFSAVSAPTVEAKTKVETKTIKVTMYVGESVQLCDLTSKAKASNKRVVKVSNKAVYTKAYPKSGVVNIKSYRSTLTAKKAGKANITYKMYYYTKKHKEVNYKVKVKITVKKRPPVLTVAKYTVAVNEDDVCYFDFKWKQTKELEEFKKYRSIKNPKYETTLKVDGETVERGNSTHFSYLHSDAFVSYDVYRVTGDTKLNEYGCDGCVLNKIDTVLEMNKDKTELFVNDKPTTEYADAVGVFNENGEELICTEDELKNIEGAKIMMTASSNYSYVDVNGEGFTYYKAGDIIKVRSGKSVTGKDIKAYIQAHPERFEITIKPISVTFRWKLNSTKYFPVYIAEKNSRAVFNWETLEY